MSAMAGTCPKRCVQFVISVNLTPVNSYDNVIPSTCGGLVSMGASTDVVSG